MSKNHSLRDAYRHPGFVPALTVRIEANAPEVYVVSLRRRQKKRFAVNAAFPLGAFTTILSASRAIWIAAVIQFSLSSISAGSIAQCAA